MVIYAPSPIAEVMSAVSKDEKYEGYDVSWWSKNPIFRHNALLISYGSNPEMDVREKLKISDDTILIGDSGGFKILSMRAKGKPIDINPLDVLRWQEKNCQIGLTLDISPTSLRAPGSSKEKSTAATYGDTITYEEYQNRLDETCKNNEVFQSNRSPSSPLKILNVVHGAPYDKLERMDEWYQRVKDFKFDGWAIAPKPAGNPLKIAVELGYLYSRGIHDNTHVFAVFGKTALPILAYIEKKMNYTNISTDSFANALLAIYRQHNTYYGPSLNYSEKNRFHTKISCACPVCSKIKTVEDLYRTDNIGYSLLCLHNTWTTVTYLKYLEALVENEKLFNIFANKISTLRTAIKFVNTTVEKGWEEAIYEAGLKQNNLEKW